MRERIFARRRAAAGADAVTKPLIVGQAPGRRSNPNEPLSGKSGRRLAALCGLDLPAFLDRFDRVNLVYGWPDERAKGDAFLGCVEARHAAAELAPRLARRRAILLGHRVAAAFHASDLPYFKWTRLGDAMIAVAPHPSGVNLFWNDPANVRTARRFWRSVSAPRRRARRSPRT